METGHSVRACDRVAQKQVLQDEIPPPRGGSG
jgi:hypothetical protein